MKHVGEFFGELAIALVLGGIGLGLFFLVQWAWSTSPLITVAAGAGVLAFLTFGAVALNRSTAEKNYGGWVGAVAAGLFIVVAASVVTFLMNGGPILNGS